MMGIKIKLTYLTKRLTMRLRMYKSIASFQR